MPAGSCRGADLSARSPFVYAEGVGVLRTWGFVAAVLVAGVSTAVAADRPVRRMDRMWAVGAPVIDDRAQAGVYVWLEERALQLAAFPGLGGRGVFRVRVTGTRPLVLDGLGDFKVVGRRGDRDVVLQARTKGRAARGKVSCDGDVSFTDVTRGRNSTSLWVGPLAKRGAKRVVIGRF